MMDRLKLKYETARNYVPRAVVHRQPNASAGIISFGSTEAAILEAQHQLSTEHDLKTDFMRVRALPFTEDVKEFVANHDRIYVVEMNRDGQMAQLLKIEYPERAAALQIRGVSGRTACGGALGPRRHSVAARAGGCGVARPATRAANIPNKTKRGRRALIGAPHLPGTHQQCRQSRGAEKWQNPFPWPARQLR